MSGKTDVFVKPGEGLVVRNPNAPKRFVAKEGELLRRTTGVIRAMKAKDLIETKPPAKAKKPKPTAPTEN